jgi:Flp pilus assembly protein TadD
LLLKAIVLSERKEFPAARAAYEQLLTLKPDAAIPLNNLAALCAEEPGQLERAHTLAKKARELDPASPAIADTLGWILCQRQDYIGALELIEQAASKLPDNPEVQYHLAMANLGLARTEAARGAFQRAASATGDFPGKSEIAARLATLERGEVAQKKP